MVAHDGAMSHSIYPLEVRRHAISLLRNGDRNADVARRLSIPAGTIGTWKFHDRARHADAYPRRQKSSCPSCESIELNEQAYSYLLGLYLGDGHIVHRGKARRFAVFCADAWPGLIDACAEAIQLVMPGAKVYRVQRQGCVAVTSYSGHWICLFPQHGPGMKHTRLIALEEWQEFVVETYPENFIRGLIHSDGCRITNWTEKTIAGQRKRYEYPRYFFVNESEDIRDLFTDTLDVLGIEWAYTRRNCISVAQRDSVAAMDTFVGPKY
jgi:hypothetical protein